MKRLLLLCVFLLSLYGCGVFRHTMTTKTVIITQIDTVLKINMEGYKPFVSERLLTDTAKLETKTGTSIAYVDPIKSIIHLEFLPKTFDVPIVINKKTIEKTKIKEPVIKLVIKFFVILFAWLTLIFLFLVWYINRKIKKIGL